MKNHIKSCLLRRRDNEVINKNGAPIILAASSQRKRKNYGSFFVGNFFNHASAIKNGDVIFIDSNVVSDNTAVTFRAINGNISFDLSLVPLDKSGFDIRLSKEKKVTSYRVHFDIDGRFEIFSSKTEALNFLGDKLHDLVFRGYSITSLK